MIASRLLSRFLITIAMFTGTLAWSAFTLQRTLFDTGRTDAVVEHILDNGLVHRAMLQALVKATEAALPEQIRAEVSLPELTSMASGAIENEDVRSAIENAVVDSHRYIIGESSEPPVLDTTVLSEVVRQQFATIRPDLATVVPEIGPITIELPSTGLRPVKAANDFTASLGPMLGIIALLGAAGGLAISQNRPATLIRIGFWAVSLGAMWIMLRYALPAASAAVLGERGVMVTGLTTAATSSMATPGTLMFGAGIALITAGYFLRVVSQPGREPATPPRGQAINPQYGTTRPRGESPRRSGANPAPAAAPRRPETRSTIPDDPGTYAPRQPQRAPSGPTFASPGTHRDPLGPQTPPLTRPPTIPGANQRSSTGRRWIEGVGYVEDETDHPA